ncbi:hypothetical protein H9L39_02250, partial [Fusarium oxysporum f. sp. albedinis]
PMADPLSIASGVAGLVSLGLTLCNGLHNYLSAVKDRYSDIETATQGLALLQSNICIIQSSTLKLSHRHALAANGVNLGLRNCETQLRALEKFRRRLDDCPQLIGIRQYIDEFGLLETSRMLIQELRTIYNSRDASPFDVDEEGNNVAHQLLKTYLYFLNVSEDLQPEDTAAEAICMILSYMFDIGVPVTAFLDISRDRSDYLWLIPRLYGLITDRDPSFCATESGHKRTIDLTSTATKEWLQRMNVWAEYPEISAAVGFHDIFLAVMQKDEPRLEAILEDGSLPTGIPLKDFHKRTVMHVSSTWPTGLSLLLQHKAGRSSLNSIVSESIAPLDCALVHSGMICKEPDQWTLCNDCDCTRSVQILLEADCSVTVGMDRAQTLESCSLKARILFFQHLRNRRERLRDVSLAYLPVDIIRRCGITVRSLPDANAMVLWAELKSRAGDLIWRGIKLSDSLQPGIDFSNPESLFTYCLHSKVAELAVQFGFRPLDEDGLPPLLSRVKTYFHRKTVEQEATYINWLLHQDLKIEYTIGIFQLPAMHRFGAIIGTKLRLDYSQHSYPRSPPSGEFGILLSKICYSRSQPNLPCPCHPEPFNRPLAHLMSGLVGCTSHQAHSWKLRHIFNLTIFVIGLIETAAPDLETAYLARSAGHTLTMQFLGIRHLPIYDFVDTGRCIHNSNLTLSEEWTEILDEDRLLIEQLHALDREFEEAFQCRNESVADFIRGYWWRRMKEVKRYLARPLSASDKRGLLEVGVLLKESTESSFDSDLDEITTSEDEYEHNDMSD